MEIRKYPNPNPNGGPLVDCPGCKKRIEHFAKGYCFNCYRKHAWKRKKVKCKNCGRLRYHKAFGLCGSCHVRLHHYDNTLRYNAKKDHNISLEKWKSLTKLCISCGFDKIVELHHLDGNKENIDNKNLVGLCPNCHKLIHTYKFYKGVREILKNKGYNIKSVHPTNYVKK